MTKQKRLIAFTMFVIMLAFQFFTSARLESKAVEVMTVSENKGLRVQLYASTWGLSGKWMNTDLLGISRTNAAKYNLANAARSLGLNRDDIKRVRMDGFVKPLYDEEYTFSTNHNKDVKVWVDDKLVVNYGITNTITLRASEVYKIELELQNQGYNEIKIYWKSESQSKKLLPYRNIFLPVVSYELVNNELTQVDYNPQSDTDGDGIPDAWERNGYTVQEGIVMPFEPAIHTVKYVTDERKSSTDGDPYTDFEEATGINMDQSVKAPGNHPLVPAYPNVEFVPTSVKIVPSRHNSEESSVKIGSGISEKVSAVNSKVDSNGGYTRGFNDTKIEIGTQYEANSATASGYIGGFYKMDSTGGMTFNSRNSISDEIKDIINNTVSESSSETDSETATIDTTNYAYLEVNGYYRNSGTATAYTVDPTLTLSIAGEVVPEEYASEESDTAVRTFNVAEGQKPHLIGPEVNYPSNGNINLSLTTTTEGYLPTPIRLTKTQVDKLELGYPFKFSGNYLSYIENGTTAENHRWSSYEHAINEVSASVTLSLPRVASVERKIYAGARMNLMEALKILYGGKVNEEGNLVIEGHEIKPSTDSQWGIRVKGPREAINNLTEQMSRADFEYEDFMLAPGLKLEIYKKDSAAEPNIITAYYNPNDSKIYASVIPGAEAIGSVKAMIRTTEGTSEVTMHAQENDDFTYVSETIYDIDTAYNNHIVAASESDHETTASISIDSTYLRANARQGLNFLQYQGEKKPFKSEGDRQRAINYVTGNTQNKYYAVMIGENLRRNYELRQHNHSVELGNTKIYNQVEKEYLVTPTNRRNSIPVPYPLHLNAYMYYGRHDGPLHESSVDEIYGNGNIGSKVTGHDIPWNERYRDLYLYSRDHASRAQRRVVKVYAGIANGDNTNVIGRPIYHYIYTGFHPRDVVDRYPLIKAGFSGNRRNARAVHRGAKVYDVSPAVGEHTQFAIIPREDLLTYLQREDQDGFYNGNALTILGMFTEEADGKVFIPNVRSYTTIAGGTSEVAVGTNKIPYAVMMNVKKRGTNPGVVKFGGTTLVVDTPSSNDDHQELVIVDAKDNGKVSSNVSNGRRVDTQVLGYFVDKEQLSDNERYLQFWVSDNPMKRTIMPLFDGEEARKRFTIEAKDVNVKGYPVRPKGFFVKVDQLNVGTKKFNIVVNGQSYSMDVGIKMKEQYDKINHTGYIFVPANTDNAYALDVTLDVDTSEAQGNQGEVQLEVMGFFYENVY